MGADRRVAVPVLQADAEVLAGGEQGQGDDEAPDDGRGAIAHGWASAAVELEAGSVMGIRLRIHTARATAQTIPSISGR